MQEQWKSIMLVLGAALVVFGIGVAVGRVTAPDRYRSGIQGTVNFGRLHGARPSHYKGQKACQRVLENTNGYDTNGSLVSRFCSAQGGRYRISLPPGKYMIEPDEPQVGDGLLKPVGPVEVRADAYTAQNLFYDNGSR
jgi:hypothetical protein